MHLFSFEQVCVEGNIGSGKSTMLEFFKDNPDIEVKQYNSTSVIKFKLQHSWPHM